MRPATQPAKSAVVFTGASSGIGAIYANRLAPKLFILRGSRICRAKRRHHHQYLVDCHPRSGLTQQE